MDYTITSYLTRIVDYFKPLNIDRSIDGFTLQYLLLEAYYDIFGIVDLDDNNTPLALVNYTNADTLGDLGPIGELINEYRNHELMNAFGLSLVDYMDLPINVAKILINRMRMEKEDEKAIKENQERALAQMEKEMKK